MSLIRRSNSSRWRRAVAEGLPGRPYFTTKAGLGLTGGGVPSRVPLGVQLVEERVLTELRNEPIGVQVMEDRVLASEEPVTRR